MDEEKKNKINKFMDTNSKLKLDDKMIALGISEEDIKILYRLPITHDALVDIVNNMILEKMS